MTQKKDVVKEMGKMEVAEFVTKAIVSLRTQGKGIHTVYSGFNGAFRKYYGTDPIAAIAELAEKGVVDVRLAHGGAALYLKGEMPLRNSDAKVQKALGAILK